jgi:Acyl-CoA dehydrogenase, N-terminal domain
MLRAGGWTVTAKVTEQDARAVAEEAREAGWTRPSFGKELFLGRFQLDLIHPHPRQDPEEAARSASFLARLREYCATLDGEVIERESKIPDEYVKGFAELGCFGVKIPPEYGGLGMSAVTYNRVLMLAASVHPSIGALLSAHQSIGSGRSCRAARPARSARSCSPSRTSALTRPGWPAPPSPTGMTTCWTA